LSTVDEIKRELVELFNEANDLVQLASDTDKLSQFGMEYQAWYSKAIKLVESLAPERLEEFISYYRIDPKRKLSEYSNYVIQDYIKAIAARTDQYNKPSWDINHTIQVRVMNQSHIIKSLSSRIDSVLQDVTGHLFAELQDKELEAATSLIKISCRAAGALAGVVLERHLQRVFVNHGLTSKKKNLTISDLNDPLKQNGAYSVPVWRKIQLLADIRNMCSHQKNEEPSKEQVVELIDGVNGIIKTVF
jgi:hypothetical protein